MRKRSKRRQRPPFSFGVFEFDEFTEWIRHQYARCLSDIDSVLDDYNQAVKDAELPEFEYPAVALSRAYDTSYLAILALAVHYSVTDEMVDAGADIEDLLFSEPLLRAAYMLDYHAKYLPVKHPEKEGAGGEASMLEKRAALVGGLLVPLAVTGFESPAVSTCLQLKKKLPKPLQSLLKKHKHKKEPLCQFNIGAFYLAFRWFPPNGDDRYWGPLIATFWNGWEDRLLGVEVAIINESLNDDNECKQEEE